MRLILAVAITASLHAQRPPIIDVHLHALRGGPVTICAQPEYWPPESEQAPCAKLLLAPASEELRLEETLRVLEEWNITAVTSGPPGLVDHWKKAGAKRIIPALLFQIPDVPAVDTLRECSSPAVSPSWAR